MMKPKTKTRIEAVTSGRASPLNTATKLTPQNMVDLLELRERHAALQAEAARVQCAEVVLSEHINRVYGNPGETIQIGPNGEITRTKKEAA